MEKKVKAVEIVEKKEVQKVETTPAMVLDFAIEKGASLEQIEKFMDLKEKWEQREAKKAYVRAMTAFKSNPPEIEKEKKVAYKDVKYSHASLDNVTKKINKALSQHGLSASWIPQQVNGTIAVTCKITHEMGHSEEVSLSAPADNSGSKNPIQAIASTVSYLERYTLLALTGLSTSDMDNDAQTAVEYINEKQLMTITDIVDNLKNAEKRKPKMLEVYKVESLDKIPASQYKRVMTDLQAAQAADKKVKA